MWFQDYNFWGCIPPSKRVLKRYLDPSFKNFREMRNILMWLLNMFISFIVVDDVPESGDPRMISRAMIMQASTIIGYAPDSDYGTDILTLFGGGTSGLSMYGYPHKGRGWGYDGTNLEFNLLVPGVNNEDKVVGDTVIESKATAVLMYDNPMAYPIINYLMVSAERMANMIRATEVAIENLKCPTWIATPETEKNSAHDLIEARQENAANIITPKGISMDSLKVWQSGMSPDIPKAIWGQVMNELSWLLTIMGVRNNPMTDKRERLNVDETNANECLTALSLSTRLDYWNYQFDTYVNPLLGTKMHARLAEGLQDAIDDTFRGYEDDPDDGAGEGDGDSGSDA